MIISIILSILVLWILFVNVMYFKNILFEKYPVGTIKGKLIRLVGYPIYVVALLWDIGTNVWAGSLIFQQLPHYKRLTLSARLVHILNTVEPYKWRYRLAVRFCAYLIEPWDMGHCGPNFPKVYF